jgi:hypothetical protein
MPRPSTLIVLGFVAAMFAWGCFAQRYATARDCWLLSLLGQPESMALEESTDFTVYVQGLPFAFFVDRKWGAWPRIGELFWLPLVADLICLVVAMFLAVRAWRWWSAPDGGQRRVQFHLSTAVILMFAASLVLWTHIAPSYERKCFYVGAAFSGTFATIPPNSSPLAEPSGYGRFRYYGWPLQYWATDEPLDTEGVPMRIPDFHSYSRWFGETRDAMVNLVYDVVSALAIVLLTGVGCEAWIVKRAKIGKARATS